MFCQNKNYCQGYSLIQVLFTLFFISIIAFFSLTGLQSWSAHEHLKQDLKNIHLGLELALADANLGQTIFICPHQFLNKKNINFYSCQASGGNQLLIIQDSNKNNIPDSEDLVLKKINLYSKDTVLTLKAFGEQDQFITLGPDNFNQNTHQKFNQNFSLELNLKNNSNSSSNQSSNQSKTGFTMSTLGDIQRIS